MPSMSHQTAGCFLPGLCSLHCGGAAQESPNPKWNSNRFAVLVINPDARLVVLKIPFPVGLITLYCLLDAGEGTSTITLFDYDSQESAVNPFPPLRLGTNSGASGSELYFWFYCSIQCDLG